MTNKNAVSAKQQDIQDDLNMGNVNGYGALIAALNEFDAIELELSTGEKVYVSTEDELKHYVNFE